MVNKQDDKIKQLFDDYAEGLAPRDDLADKARATMTATKFDTKQSDSAHKKSTFWRNFAWIAPVVSVFVIVVIALISTPIFIVGSILRRPSNSPGTTPPTLADVPTEYYTFADVKGRRVQLEDYDDVLRISAIKDDYEVVSERYYAFFTADGELRYIKAFLGVRSGDGTFTELELIAEVDGYVRSDLSETYNTCKRYTNFVSINDYDRGEYITKGFFYTRDMHFYIISRNGQSWDAAKEIISAIVPQD